VHAITKQAVIEAQTFTEGTPTKGRTTPTLSARLGLAYEWFLEWPVRVAVLVLWVAGVVLLGTCALVAYAAVSALLGMVAGAF
jgi:hypothetical protein